MYFWLTVVYLCLQQYFTNRSHCLTTSLVFHAPFPGFCINVTDALYLFKQVRSKQETGKKKDKKKKKKSASQLSQTSGEAYKALLIFLEIWPLLFITHVHFTEDYALSLKKVQTQSPIWFCPEARTEWFFMKMMIKKKRASIIFLFFQSPAALCHLGYCH